MKRIHEADKGSLTSQKLGSRSFWRIANNVFNISKSTIPSLFNNRELLCSTFHKAKLFAKNVSKNSFQNSKNSLHNFSGRLLLFKIFFLLSFEKFQTSSVLQICHGSQIPLTPGGFGYSPQCGLNIALHRRTKNFSVFMRT